jgi:hypothetical protein
MMTEPIFPNLTLGLDFSDTSAHDGIANAHGQILVTGSSAERAQ